MSQGGGGGEANIINIAQNHSHHLFCYMKKRAKIQEVNVVVFSAQENVHQWRKVHFLNTVNS